MADSEAAQLLVSKAMQDDEDNSDNDDMEGGGSGLHLDGLRHLCVTAPMPLDEAGAMSEGKVAFERYIHRAATEVHRNSTVRDPHLGLAWRITMTTCFSNRPPRSSSQRFGRSPPKEHPKDRLQLFHHNEAFLFSLVRNHSQSRQRRCAF
jgi:hypothetical protein